jgi:hypothetical protein
MLCEAKARLAKKHRTLMMSRFFVIGGIEFIVKCLNVMILSAKIRKIGVETGVKGLYIKFFHDLLHFFKEKLCG